MLKTGKLMTEKRRLNNPKTYKATRKPKIIIVQAHSSYGDDDRPNQHALITHVNDGVLEFSRVLETLHSAFEYQLTGTNLPFFV